jgi:hypothetical protein
MEPDSMEFKVDPNPPNDFLGKCALRAMPFCCCIDTFGCRCCWHQRNGPPCGECSCIPLGWGQNGTRSRRDD